jgi:hypothetical protein
LAAFFCAAIFAPAQSTPSLANLNQSGHIVVAGHSTPYLVRHLPVDSFPQLPAEVQQELSRRGCLIPQTYEAQRPENVIHGGFERPGSSDWAVLCSVEGTVSLLVFFGDHPGQPSVLASSPETERLQPHGSSGVLGFNWGIDTASPQQVHDAQAGMTPRPPPLDHDTIADSVVEHTTIYHFYTKGAWTLIEPPN